MLSTKVIESDEVESRFAHSYPRSAESPGHSWASLYRVGGLAALAVVALIPIQAAVVILWPPPTTVLEYFSTFQSNPLLGLLDLDLLLIVDQLLIIAVLLALYAALRHSDPSLMLLGTALGVIGAVLFIVSREATFSMLFLSQQYGPASSEADRAALLAAGQTLLTTYNGTAFILGYCLSGVAMLLVSMVMLRGNLFSRATGIAGVLAGVTGLVPANFGTLGLALAFISLLPLMAWLALTGRRLLQTAANSV